MAEESPFDRGSSRQRAKSSAGIGAESPDSGLDDMRDFRDDLQEKQLTLDNVNETIKTFLSKRGSIETFIGEMFSEFSSEEQTYQNMMNNEQYLDTDGFVSEETNNKAEDQIDILKRIIEWREVQISTMMVLIRKLQELVSRQKGKDVSRDVLEEMKSVFDQKFESDKEKLEMIEEMLNEKIVQNKKTIQSEIDDLERNQRRMMKEMETEMNKTNQVLEALGDKLDEDFDSMEFSDEFKDMMEEQSREIREMKDEVRNQETKETDNSSEPEFKEEDNTESSITSGSSSNAPSQVQEKMENQRPDPEELDWSFTKTSTEKVEDPEFGFTHDINPDDVSGMGWDALRQLDKGHLTEEEIKEASESMITSFPIDHLNNLVSMNQIQLSELPNELAEKVRNKE